MATATSTGIVLSPGAAVKIKKMSDAFDQRKQRAGGRSTPAGPVENEIWGLLTGCDLSGKRYSFVRVIPNATNDDPDVIINGGEIGFNIVDNAANNGLIYTAYEVNGAIGAVMQIVRLTFAGYRLDSDTGTKVPVFMFQFEQLDAQLPLAIHDHRDNVTGAGFAFAVYHPGTSLPAQPWSV